MNRRFLLIVLIVVMMTVCTTARAASVQTHNLWDIYQTHLKSAKYVDLTHAFNPTIPVWPGFGHATFNATKAGSDLPDYIEKGEEYTYNRHGFIATAYQLPTDQYGTQLDPPAHWDEYGATISDIPPTYAIRPLVVCQADFDG